MIWEKRIPKERGSMCFMKQNREILCIKKRERSKRFCTVLYGIAAVLLLALLSTLLVGRAQHRVVFLFDRATVWILSGSMEPNIRAKSCILIEKIPPSQVEVGNVITFYSEDPALQGQLNTHRVVGISEDHRTFRTQGDHNLREDRYEVPAENVVGRYVKEMPAVTAVLRFFLTPKGACAALGGVAVLAGTVCLSDLWKLLRRRKKKSKAGRILSK